MEENKPANEYYLQVVRVGEQPEWPKGEGELSVGSQSLGSGFIQYWAYPISSGLDSGALPAAERVASKNPTEKAAILIDQPGSEIELILVKDNHAWAREVSNINNLEDNISSLLDFGKNKFNILVEHFMTTDRVSDEVEGKLNEIETQGEGEQVEEDKNQESMQPEDESDTPLGFRPVGGNKSTSQPRSYSLDGDSRSSSKLWLALPIITLVIVAGGIILFRHQIISKLTQRNQPESTPAVTLTPTPSPTPTPAVDRTQYKLRVLNGTLKSGAAGTLADSLKALGWQILKTGNADDSNTLKTTVKVKVDKKSILPILVADLGKDYDASTSADLVSTDKADAEIVIGAK